MCNWCSLTVVVGLPVIYTDDPRDFLLFPVVYLRPASGLSALVCGQVYIDLPYDELMITWQHTIGLFAEKKIPPFCHLQLPPNKTKKKKMAACSTNVLA